MTVHRALVVVFAATSLAVAPSVDGAAPEGPLRIYSSLPLRSESRPQALDIVRAERMALEEAGSTAAGHPIEFISLDDSTRRAGKWTVRRTAANAARAASDERAVAYLGEFNSAASAISIPIINEGGLLQVSPSNTYVGLTRREGAVAGEPDLYYPTGVRTYARVVPADHLQAAALAALMASSGVRRVLLLDDGEPYGSGMARMVRRRAAARGLAVRGPFDAWSGRWRARVRRLVRSSGADAMVFGGITERHAAGVFNAVDSAAPEMMLFGADGVLDSRFTRRLSAGAAKRTLLTFPAVRGASYSPAGQAFEDAFRARYGHLPYPYGIFGYEAMKVTLAAIDAGDGDRAATIQAFFATHDRDSVLGRYSIDSNGDTTLPLYGVARIEHGLTAFDHVVDSS